MDTPVMRYTVESQDGTEQHHLNDPALAFTWALSLADRDGSAHLIERLPDEDVRGYVVKANT